MKWKYAAMMLGACAFAVVSASAATVGLSGNFSSSGRVVINQFACANAPCPGSTVWSSDQPGNAPDMFTLSGSVGNLFLNGNPLNENGQNVIHDLNNPPQGVGALFTAFDFIDFSVAAAPSLMANFISNGQFAGTGCTDPTGPGAAGQTCTLLGSPFGFSNSQPIPGGPITSTVTFTVSGVTSDGLSTWLGQFSANFNTSYQTVIAPFIANGGKNAASTIPNTYADTEFITITPVPEPSSMLLIGGGLIGLATMLRRRRTSK